jgi:hypothetical protein
MHSDASIGQALLDLDHVPMSNALQLAQVLEPLRALLLIDVLLAWPPRQHLACACDLVALRCCLHMIINTSLEAQKGYKAFPPCYEEA